ncbi:MAG TPA: NADH-quinone oxidoreductase subunit C [Dehalococcoidia bacterium]|nr:NADH-quinone oxidoreductase subunit C [Dehalococcoidia bacterium]
MSDQTLAILQTSPVRLARVATQAANEVLVSCDRADLARAGAYLDSCGARLATMVGLDLTPLGDEYAVEYVYSLPAFDEFIRIRAAVPRDDPEYPSLTPLLPAAQWYEREVKDLLGLIPVDHPDPRRLVLHETWPHGYHPLRKDVSAIEPPPRDHRRFDYFEVHGEGIYELPVGPIHAGIIEPGHFRFSNAGELILHLDARLFYTHRGVEKIVEGKSFEEALFVVERTCGVCTVSHAVSFCSAVERMAGAELSQAAIWLRTLLLELERLYNHVGDIGNICAGAGFHLGSSQGAILKERMQRLNEALTGHRFLMGVVGLGGLRYDLKPAALTSAAKTLAELRSDFEAYMDVLLSSRSFVSRITGPGHVSADTVLALGATGVAARASGISTDYRREHPYLAYGHLQPECLVEAAGDVGARLMVRAREALASFDMAVELIASLPAGTAVAAIPPIPAGASALGYSESPRGSNVHWLMADADSRVYRLRIRSASFANWPLVTRAVVENMVPDFPLINKSFELCYACCDR